MALRPDPLAGANAFVSRAISVTSTAATLSGNYPLGSILYNNGTATIYLGGADVDTSNGFPLASKATVSSERFQTLSKLYAVVASSSQELRVLGMS